MTHPDPDPLDVTPRTGYVPGMKFGTGGNELSPLSRFREQRRRSRWNCSVLALVAALIVFWGTVGVILWKVVAG